MNNGPTDVQEDPKKLLHPTPLSDFVGASLAGVAKQILFQPLDVLTSNRLLGKNKFSQFFNDLGQQSWQEKLKTLYRGSLIEMFKKFPVNGYRFTAQKVADRQLGEHYTGVFSSYFGEYSRDMQAGVSGAIITGSEPLLFQPFQTIQFEQQTTKSTRIRGIVAKQGIKGIYKGMGPSALLINPLSGGSLFGVSAAINRKCNNDDKRDQSINIMAKTTGAFVGTILTQPGEVIRAKVLRDKCSLIDAFKRLSLKEYGNAFPFRMVGAIRAGAGYWLAEQGMEFAATFLGASSSDAEDRSTPRLK